MVFHISVFLLAIISLSSVGSVHPGKGRGHCDKISFLTKDILTKSGQNIPLQGPTSIVPWADGKLYIGTGKGQLQVVEYDSETLLSISICHSEVLTDSRYKKADGSFSDRSILGIAFDPRDTVPRPYVSVSSLFWERYGNVDKKNPHAWSNGAVERFKPASASTRAKDPDQCLEHDRNIVQNLPVSDGDHSVNELLFDQNGDLLISVGSNTNAGLPLALLGGNWDSYFSGSIVRARLSKGESFNGVIPYTTPENLRTAAPKPGYTDVELYATGFRNLFSFIMSRSGRLYGIDMGPNCRFGNASSSCGEYVESDASKRSTSIQVPFPGKLITGPPGDCKYGNTRPDKLLEIKRGKFYGHPNLPRSALTGRKECQWVDPLTGLVPAPFNSFPSRDYEHNMALVDSPATGIAEYGSTWFCGKLRGDLLMSELNDRGLRRMHLRGNKKVMGKPSRISKSGGIRVAENEYGDLLLPKHYHFPSAGVQVLRPKLSRSSRKGFVVSNAIPFRHGRGGGTRIIIGGLGFTPDVLVRVGGSACPIVQQSGTKITCIVPTGPAGKLVDITVSVGGTLTRLAKAVLYMNV